MTAPTYRIGTTDREVDANANPANDFKVYNLQNQKTFKVVANKWTDSTVSDPLSAETLAAWYLS